MDLRPLIVPLVHKFWPTPGPGGVASLLSLLLHADATKMAHVTRYLDVMEVWQRDDDFSVRTYDERMTATTGPFILGMNDLGRYTPDDAVIRRAIRRDDAALVQRIAREEADLAVDRVRRTGRIDVVKDLGEIVPMRLVTRYFGLDVEDPALVLRLFQEASWYIFSFWFDPNMRDVAIRSAEALRPILASAIRRRRDEGGGDHDVLGRLVRMADGFVDGDAGIARSMGGLCSGTLNAPIGLFAGSVNEVMSLDAHVQRSFHEAARSASLGCAEDYERLKELFVEAERFAVFPSVLYRYAERDAVLAVGTRREKRIPKGTTVVVWPSLGAFDDEVFERPFEFLPGRPKWQYMGFGQGRHRCLGEYVGQTLLFEMARALFSLPRLRRRDGKEGTVRSYGTEKADFPYSFVLEFDRSS